MPLRAGVIMMFTNRVVLTTLLSAVSVVYNCIQVRSARNFILFHFISSLVLKIKKLRDSQTLFPTPSPTRQIGLAFLVMEAHPLCLFLWWHSCPLLHQTACRTPWSRFCEVCSSLYEKEIFSHEALATSYLTFIADVVEVAVFADPWNFAFRLSLADLYFGWWYVKFSGGFFLVCLFFPPFQCYVLTWSKTQNIFFFFFSNACSWQEVFRCNLRVYDGIVSFIIVFLCSDTAERVPSKGWICEQKEILTNFFSPNFNIPKQTDFWTNGAVLCFPRSLCPGNFF